MNANQDEQLNTNNTSNEFSTDSMPNASLPTELILEILQFLPVLTLIICRSVCKLWLSLISSPDFITTHLLKSIETTQFVDRRLISTPHIRPFNRIRDCSVCYLLNGPSWETPEVDSPMKDPSKFVIIVGTCNGLVCLATSNDPLFLWNPVTRKSKELPISEKIVNYESNQTVYGFGYDECSDDYKVVATFSNYDEEKDTYKIELEIYSLRLDCWKRIEDLPCRRLLSNWLREEVIFANGALHWAASHEMFVLSDDAWIIVSLDLKTEKYSEVAQPKYREGDYHLTLGVLERSLCVLCGYRNFETDVWVMNEYGVKDSWTILVRIPCLGNPLPNWYAEPLCVSASGDIVLNSSEYGIVVYNSKDYTFKKTRKFITCCTPHTYIESLVSPNV